MTLPVTNQLAAIARAKEATQAQEWPGAVAAWEAVVEANPVNGRYHNRLAEARFALGDYAGAVTAYERVLALGVWGEEADEDSISVLPGMVPAMIACCHARLGDAGRAHEALAEAMRQGLRQFNLTELEAQVPGIRAELAIDELWPAPPSDVSRVDGWRADLRRLQSEVHRRAPTADPGFDAAVAELEAALLDLDDIHIVLGLYRLLRLLDDGHAGIVTQSMPDPWCHVVPMHVFPFVEGLFVTDVDASHEQLLGSELLAVDGHPARDVRRALDPLLTRDNELTPLASLPDWLRRPAWLHAVGVAADPGRATFTLRLTSGEVVDVVLQAEKDRGLTLRSRAGWKGAQRMARWLPETLPGPIPAYIRPGRDLYWFEHQADDELVYFQLNGVADDESRPEEPLAACFDRLFGLLAERRVPRLVIDLRWNGGGNTFMAVPLVHHVIRSDINRPGQLFVIVGRYTFSAAQNLSTLLDRHTHAVFVGEPSGSRPNFTGETAPFQLPFSRLLVNISDLYWQTSWPFDQRRAIAPHIYAPPAFSAYANNRDPAMDAILASIQDG